MTAAPMKLVIVGTRVIVDTSASEQQREHDRISQIFADERAVTRLGLYGRSILERRRARNVRKRRARVRRGHRR